MLMDAFGRTRIEDQRNERPIFVFAAGERCGSTLVQRLLSSHPDVFIWGEQKGALEEVCQFYRLASIQAGAGEQVAQAYLDSGLNEFIANLSPSHVAVQKAVQGLLRILYGGFSLRWGCKEVRCDASVARMLVELFPGASVVFIIRHLSAVLSSLGRWGYDWHQCADVVDRWVRIGKSIACRDGDLAERSWVCRYEDVVRDPERRICDLAAFLALDAGGLDNEILRTRVPDHSCIERVDRPSPRSLIPLDEETASLLRREDVCEVLSCFQYE
jgi:hypothetical protein